MIKVLFFGAEHCPMCHVFRPKVEDVCNKKGYEFQFIDADSDDNAGILATYGIRNIPFVVILEDGELKEKGIASNMLEALKA